MTQVSNAENGLKGTGEANGKKFAYECTYNIRDGSTSHVKVHMKKVHKK